MAVFTLDEVLKSGLDWQILQNGWASLYFKKVNLDQDTEWFKSKGFSIVEFDCKTWRNKEDIIEQFKMKLNFPEWLKSFGFDSVNDLLADIEIDNIGKIIVFYHFDTLDKGFSHELLDIFCDKARWHMLFGKKLIILVQVDNPQYTIDDVGSTHVSWNNHEWLDSSRNVLASNDIG